MTIRCGREEDREGDLWKQRSSYTEWVAVPSAFPSTLKSLFRVGSPHARAARITIAGPAAGDTA